MVGCWRGLTVDEACGLASPFVFQQWNFVIGFSDDGAEVADF